ncbi:threonine dehydratase [Methylopila capsulata]|uniref:Threonine ammonia-lyase n=1 Tax=Methylopila capsulata TaxID=61654 RepID=A0A9W6ITZ6_9HYPH|nr:threonine ammonia-lyase [Methylopila capsulata]MBM7849973.1 threonine dehydratase [Methylopila capsulata]GLK55265.1 threonine ammonia-lyase [Methylopila capsulata]
MTVTLADVQAAQKILEGAVTPSPLLAAPKLSAMTGAKVLVKYENLHVTNAFKERGAVVRLSRLDADSRARGVIAMSAGNHAQAVAYHARRLGIPATIVMPETTPHVKVAATRGFGAEVVLDGETVAESQIRASAIALERGLTFVHPYDDPDVIAGQGTIALEMLADAPELDVILVPIGGGGLISGVAVAAKALKPSIEIIGVEAALYPSMWNALKGADLPTGGPTLAEGIAVKTAGALTREIAARLVDDIILVSEAELERAVNAYLMQQKAVAEGAGAAGLAALFAAPGRFAGKTVGLILCGGNIDPRILASIMVRELEREQKILAFRMTIADRPGMLGTIATRLGELGANILEVHHQRGFLDVPAKGATLDLTVEIRDGAHADAILTSFTESGLPCRRLDGGAGG